MSVGKSSCPLSFSSNEAKKRRSFDPTHMAAWNFTRYTDKFTLMWRNNACGSNTRITNNCSPHHDAWAWPAPTVTPTRRLCGDATPWVSRCATRAGYTTSCTASAALWPWRRTAFRWAYATLNFRQRKMLFEIRFAQLNHLWTRIIMWTTR